MKRVTGQEVIAAVMAIGLASAAQAVFISGAGGYTATAYPNLWRTVGWSYPSDWTAILPTCFSGLVVLPCCGEGRKARLSLAGGAPVALHRRTPAMS